MKVRITPISSMWPASMMVGLPPALTSAMLLPATSAVTLAKLLAYLRQSFAGALSKPEGPGVSRSDLRKVSDSADNPFESFVFLVAITVPNQEWIAGHDSPLKDEYSTPAAGSRGISRRGTRLSVSMP